MSQALTNLGWAAIGFQGGDLAKELFERMQTQGLISGAKWGDKGLVATATVNFGKTEEDVRGCYYDIKIQMPGSTTSALITVRTSIIDDNGMTLWGLRDGFKFSLVADAIDFGDVTGDNGDFTSSMIPGDTSAFYNAKTTPIINATTDKAINIEVADP